MKNEIQAHLADRNRKPMCSPTTTAWRFQTTPSFGQVRCLTCVGMVRNAATDAGLADPCRPKVKI